ncbi:MAG: hypothetical protein MI802_13870, partial [Desulfobacterales bacterium]|nr:hypothetical protein [Desulfobacterales bacterium]
EEVRIGQTETSPEPAKKPSTVKNEQRKPSFLQKTPRMFLQQPLTRTCVKLKEKYICVVCLH